MVWAAFVYLGPDPEAFVRVFSRFGHCVENLSRDDRTILERARLGEEWASLRLEEETFFGASEIPERDLVDEGVRWDRARLDEEWRRLRREEERVSGTGDGAARAA